MIWLYVLGIWTAVSLLAGAFFAAGAWNRARLTRRREAVVAEQLARPTITYLPPERRR